MDSGVLAAIIAALAALLVAILGNIFTFASAKAGLKRFRQEWVTNLHTAYELERHKIRLASYPEAFRIIGKLSHHAREPLTAEIAHQVAHELNDWLYSAGGMSADTSTRGAIVKLRSVCSHWEVGQKKRPDDLYLWRNRALFLLRNDIGLQGLETKDFQDTPTLLKQVQEQVALALSENSTSK
jgi:hypothetical protein